MSTQEPPGNPDSIENEASLIKAKVTQTSRLLKSRDARKWLAKRQKQRGGVGNGMYKLQARSHDGSATPGDLAKADGYIRTIMDMVDLHYGYMPQKFGAGAGIKKADNNLTYSGAGDGVANVVFGQEVFSLLNSESNVFSLLEKRPWRRSGTRFIDGRAAGGNHTLGSGGVQEDASLPDTDHPAHNSFETTPRNVAHTFSVSQVEQLLADTEDDHYANDPMDFYRRWYGTGTEHQTGQGEHPKHINVQLAQDRTNVGTNDFRSIDQAISDANEASIGNEAASDIYGFDRSSNEYESNVLENGGTNRNFVVNFLDDAITDVREQSGKDPVQSNSYFWLTNHETFQVIEEETAGYQRLEPVRATVGMNGVQTQPGDDVGITVQAYKDIPIFRSDDVATDGIGRVYLIDSDTLFIKQLLPTQYYSTGITEDNNPFGIDRLGNEGMFLTIGELTLTNPKAHAKIRDLQ